MKKHIKICILIPVILSLLFSSLNITAASRFTDISRDAWYFESMMVLYSLGVINGYPDNSFKPDDPVKGDEFLKMVITSLGFELDNSEGYWASNYIDKCDETGLTNNLIDTDYTLCFTRAKACVVISAALDYLKEKPDRSESYPFDLGVYTPDIYVDHIKKCCDAGIITGFEDYTFRYNEQLTRAQACIIIQKLIYPDKREKDVKPDLSFLSRNESETLRYINTNYDELTDVMKNMLAQIKDNVEITVVEKREYETKDIYEIRYHKTGYTRPEHCMFAFRFYDGDTAYPEKKWGYDTMFMKVELRGLDWQDGIPASYYKSKIKDALVTALYGYDCDGIADYMIKTHDHVRALYAVDAYNLLEDNSTQDLRYVFFTMDNVILNFTFSNNEQPLK